MTVSRRGKRGTRTGHMIPESRNKRALRNAGLKNLSKNSDDRPSSNKKSKEEWVIRVATNVVGARGGKDFVSSDDVVSDIILGLLDAGGFNWDEDEIVHFCRKKAMYYVQDYLGRREVSECNLVKGGGIDHKKEFRLTDIKWSQEATQPTYVDAHDAYRRLQAIPDQHRLALEILCGGGNPIDVAEEMGLTPWAAIALIKEARQYVDRVDPMEDAA